MQSPYQDDKVAESEAFISGPEERPPLKRTLTSSKTAIILSLLAAAILGFITSSAYNYIQHLPPKTLHCGKTPAEARALGCEFDLLAAGWVPKPCLDHTSNEEYMKWVFDSHRKMAPFPYFKDGNGTQRISDLKELSEYTGTVFTTSEEHLGHCAQQAKRIHRAAVKGGQLARINTDDKASGVISTVHIGHCVKMLWEQLSNGYVNGKPEGLYTQFSIEYMTC